MEVDLTKFRKEVTAPFSGQRFIIRRVRFKEFITQVGGLPLPLNATVQATLNQLREKMSSGDDSDVDDRITRFYVSKGVVEPRVWMEDPEQCPSGAVCYTDLGSDLDFLASEVIQYSNEVASLKAMDNFFRGPGAGVAGPDGETIRPEAIEPAAESNS